MKPNLHRRYAISDADRAAGRTVLQTAPRYQCVYCKRRVRDLWLVPVHEAQCDARALMHRFWLLARAKAERRERKGTAA